MLTPQNARLMKFTTAYPPDKLVGDPITGSFTATASGSILPHRTNETISHSFGVPVFLQMTYSRDGGTTWQDQHVGVPDLTIPTAPVFQTLDVGCYSTSSDIIVPASNFTMSDITVDYVIVPIWNDRSSQVISVSQASGGGSDDTGFIFTTKHNLPKIYLDAAQTVSAPSSPATPTTVLTVNHDLGYVPTARVWYEPVSGQIWPLSPNQYDNSDGGPGTTLTLYGRFYVTSTTLVVEMFNSSGGPLNVPIHTRIYCDE
jgi:hypothetical protein